MSFAINTNVMSLVAQQNLNKSQDMLNQAIARLSSGKKINSAADDAAGQAIANRMSAQINGLTQARANANDGISLAQTTEGALDQINTNLQRIRELSVQALNGTNTASDLDSIQDEIDQRLAEIDRISAQTAFNGIQVLDGSEGSISIQVGADDGETISINLQQINASTLGLTDFNVAGDQAATTSDVLSKLAANDTVTVGDGTNGTTWTKQADGSYLATMNGTGNGVADGDTIDAAGLQSAISNSANDTTVAMAANVNVTTITTAGAVTDGTNTVYLNGEDGTLIIDTDAKYDVNTVDPLTTLDAALNDVGAMRSNLGAVQNRFDSAITNLSTTVINLKSARSRIVDADYAVAVSQMSKAKILQQAGTAVLAQSNQTNQGVLALLR